MSNGIGHVWAVNAEGGDEGRPNGVGPVWIENADQLGSKLPEPESGDAGKVLGVLNSDGDIGWVIDQSGTFTQVQADWDQTDSSQVSYIANKPSLATVATTGAYSDLSGTPTIPTVDQIYDASSANAQSGVAVASAISGKQDTINDLETIRSGAAAGATAVQPAALNDYATTSALTSGLSTKQDTISDLETIRSGAAAGATAVQPNSLATVATTGNYSDLSGKPTIPTVDQTYNAASANAQSGVAVASAVSGKQDTISDLATIRSGAEAGATAVQPGDLATVATTGSYDDLLDKPTIPPGVVVDQVYDASSTNAQSGTAVAGAISGVRQVPSTSSGDNGKVLGVTDSSGTLGWVAKDEANLFYVTYNVTTFDEIKAAHDAGKWPVLVDSNGRVAPMVDYNWVGGASSIQNAKFQVSEYDYTADTNGADYYNTVYNLVLDIDAYSERTETWSTTSNNASADWNAVSGPRVIRNKPTIPSVDQTYNSASANAQSGVAVAQAIAAIPSAPTYTAGDGIAISAQNAISAKVGGGVTIGNASSTASVTDNLSVTPIRDGNVRLYPIFGRLNADTANALANGSVTIKTLIDWTNGSYTLTKYRPGIFVYNASWGYNKNTAMMFGTNAISGFIGNIPANTEIVYDINDVNTSLSNLTIETILANPTNYVFFALPCDSSGNIDWNATYGSVTSSTAAAVISTATYQSTVTVPNSIILENPLPASAVGDADKVLTVNASGNPEWATAQSGSSYTAGDGITITSNVISVATDDTISKVFPLGDTWVSVLTNDNGQGKAYYDSNDSGLPLGDVLNTWPQHGTLRVVCGAGRFYLQGSLGSTADVKAYVVISSDQYFNNFAVYPTEIPATYVQADDAWIVDAVDVTVPTIVSTTNGWISKNNPDYGHMRYIGIGFGESANDVSTGTIAYGDTNIYPSHDVRFQYPNITANKVLSVTLGDVTSIQQVNALPANPDANTLYLIPEA